jgi:hypothetical protein
MPRRARFAEAAEAWLRKHSPGKAVSTDELWHGLCKEHPVLTTPTEKRKTPRTTCMRDLRKDGAFSIGDRKVSLK